ncbi:sugar ABC transporter ATP-binding protein [Peribacillus frigoritolerans]|uniref:sugar ABC transporter ATP-binding protein n=1 Tax=Peribacillus frigoritolerans TaxID=450367 RepID=UPI003D353973
MEGVTRVSNILEMKQVSKSFPGVKAVQNVNFTLKKGEVHCLIGANGAGKSTLMKILSGVYTKDEGEIRLEGKPVTIKTPVDSMSLGISTIYQELSLVEELSLAENIFLGNYLKPNGGFVKWRKINEEAKRLFSILGLSVSPTMQTSKASMGLKQMTEIAKAIAAECKIIIMDEPSTALSNDEVLKLYDVIKLLKKQGYTIVYISHKLEELYAVGDRVTVLRNGKWVITDEMKNLEQPDLIRHITGRSIEKRDKVHIETNREEFLKVKGFTNHKIQDVSFSVSKGEIVGLYGLVGSGRTELLRAIYGADPIQAGELMMDGMKKIISSPQKAVDAGMGLVPENRKTEGANLDLSILENAFLPSLHTFSKRSFVKQQQMKMVMQEMIKKLNIKTSGSDVPMRNLSGGNQQKVIISRWLIKESKILLFDEPTQGIDVGAKDEIYSIMKELSNQGTSIIMATSEIEELLTVCDRVLIMFEGKLIKEFSHPSNYKSEIMNIAVSG